MKIILGPIFLSVVVLFSLKDSAHSAPQPKFFQIQSGQTLDSILSDLGFAANVRGQIFSDPKFPKSYVLVPGATYKVQQGAASKEVVLFDFAQGRQWNLREHGGAGELVVQEGEWSTYEKRVRGKIVGSLFNSLRAHVDSKKLAYRFQEVFLGAVDFSKLPAGTPFEMVYEELYLRGKPVGYGRMLYGKVQVDGNLMERYLVRSSHGSFYVDPSDDQADRLFYAPVGEVKISSVFQRRRFHPVRKRWVAHHGQDYELETGSPVRAAQKGVIEKIGYDRASGRHVIVDHGSGWQSLYLHLEEFAEGLTQGSFVTAGALLGSVGCSGYCTRPHLHFALKHKGTYRDPAPITKSFSAPQAILAKNHAVMISSGRLAAWRDREEFSPQNRN